MERAGEEGGGRVGLREGWRGQPLRQGMRRIVAVFGPQRLRKRGCAKRGTPVWTRCENSACSTPEPSTASLLPLPRHHTNNLCESSHATPPITRAKSPLAPVEGLGGHPGIVVQGDVKQKRIYSQRLINQFILYTVDK